MQPHYITVHCVASLCYHISLHYRKQHHITLHYVALQCNHIILQYTALHHCVTLYHCITVNNITLHYITLLCNATTLNYITLLCNATTLHYVTLLCNATTLHQSFRKKSIIPVKCTALRLWRLRIAVVPGLVALDVLVLVCRQQFEVLHRSDLDDLRRLILVRLLRSLDVGDCRGFLLRLRLRLRRFDLRLRFGFLFGDGIDVGLGVRLGDTLRGRRLAGKTGGGRRA